MVYSISCHLQKPFVRGGQCDVLSTDIPPDTSRLLCSPIFLFKMLNQKVKPQKKLLGWSLPSAVESHVPSHFHKARVPGIRNS